MNPKILIIDDNTDILINLKFILELHDYMVYSAENGKQALKILEELEHFIIDFEKDAIRKVTAVDNQES